MHDGGHDSVAGSVTAPERAISWRFSRSGGPGGQHVNTSDSRVELLLDTSLLEGPAELVELVRSRLGDEVRVVASNRRSQAANKAEALRRLAARIDAAAKRPKPRRPTRPHKGAVEERLRLKRRQSQRKTERRVERDD